MKGTAYLFGPMRGYPDYNRATFRLWGRLLEAEGLKVINPADLDSDGPAFKDYTDYYRRDIPYLLQVDMGIALPGEGWRQSEGASLESFIFKTLKTPVLHIVGKPKKGMFQLRPLRSEDLPSLVHPNT